MDDRAVSTVQTALAETRWLPVPCPTEYLPALARDVLYALERAGFTLNAPVTQQCGCYCCLDARGESRSFMVLCPDCGCKRCPKATNHVHACSGSNTSGQVGSVYGEPCPEVCCNIFEASRFRKRAALYDALAAENPAVVATPQEPQWKGSP